MTNTKKYFKVSMFNATAGYSITMKLNEMAALANGGKDITIDDMTTICKMEKISSPGSLSEIEYNLIGSTITIDKGTECIMVIEEREELVLVTDENDGKFAVSNSI